MAVAETLCLWSRSEHEFQSLDEKRRHAIGGIPAQVRIAVQSDRQASKQRQAIERFGEHEAFREIERDDNSSRRELRDPIDAHARQ